MKYAFLLITGLLLLNSCKKMLDLSPQGELTTEQAFSSESNMQLYINSFYQQMLPGGPSIYQGDLMSDITVPNIVPKYINGFSPQEATAWNFGSLRNVNYFLEHYSNSPVSKKAKNHYAGIAKFFRAWYYFNMVKQYGDVQWYNKVLEVSDPDVYKPRDPRKLVMDSVLADINFACNNIYDLKDNTCTQITRSVALALKSRICIFEGTYRKYHTEISLAGSSAAWLKEAASAAATLMQEGKYNLQNTNAPEKDYRSLFINETPLPNEILLATVYNTAMRRLHDATFWYNGSTQGSRMGLSKTFVNSYLNNDGTRFTDLAGYETIQFATEVKNRDKRLQQTIRTGVYKRTDGTVAIPDFNVTYSGYHILKFSLDDRYYDTKAESSNSLPILRYAEVLLNFAEAKAELGALTVADWNASVAALRSRAGIIKTTMPVTADTYLQQKFFPEISDPVLLEVRRERSIELAGEGFRYDDLKRWKTGKLLERPYDGLYVPAKGQLIDLNEDGKPDVSFVDKVPAIKISGVVYFILDGTTSRLSQGDKGNLIWQGNIIKNYDDKKYLYPISLNELTLNPNLVQNPGWNQ